DALGNSANALNTWIVRRQDMAAGLAQYLVVGLFAQGQFFLRPQPQLLRAVSGTFARLVRQLDLAPGACQDNDHAKQRQPGPQHGPDPSASAPTPHQHDFSLLPVSAAEYGEYREFSKTAPRHPPRRRFKTFLAAHLSLS